MSLWVVLKSDDTIIPYFPTRWQDGIKHHECLVYPELFNLPTHVPSELITGFRFKTKLYGYSLLPSGEYRLGKATAVVDNGWHWQGMGDSGFDSAISIYSDNLQDLQLLWRRIRTCTILPYLWHKAVWYNPVSWIGRLNNALTVSRKLGRI